MSGTKIDWEDMAFDLGYKHIDLMLKTLYEEKGLSLEKMKKMLNISIKSICVKMDEFGIKRNKPGNTNGAWGPRI